MSASRADVPPGRLASPPHAPCTAFPESHVWLTNHPLSNTRPGTFEQRIEIYTPPYLYRGGRPELTAGPERISRGGTGLFTTRHASSITAAKLMRPSAVTHVTDTDQRSVALDLEKSGDSISVTVPRNRALVPSGWYMLFVTDADGTPSEGMWVEIP